MLLKLNNLSTDYTISSHNQTVSISMLAVECGPIRLSSTAAASTAVLHRVHAQYGGTRTSNPQDNAYVKSVQTQVII